MNRVVYCFWTGDNEMSKNRINAYKSLSNACVPVKLITRENLEEYIHPEYPLHKAYPYLSSVHKADYLRCYFMHIYGGGYCDIKIIKHSWIHLFDYLDRHNEKWIVGYREIARKAVAAKTPEDYLFLADNYHLLIGNAAYICKPNTPFTTEWFNELHQKLDDKYDELVKNPAKTHRDYKSDTSDYPLGWNEILGQIFHMLTYKYRDNIWNRLRCPILYNYV